MTEPLPRKRKIRQPLYSQLTAEVDKGSDIWLITLSDLLMLLVIFFVILFSFELHKQKPTIPPRVETKVIQAENKAPEINNNPAVNMASSIEKDLLAIFDLKKGQSGITVKRMANLVTLTFPEQIVFDPGHAQLKPSAQDTLDKVASFIRERPHLVVEVQGHTDDQPIKNSRYPSNWELSVDRATQVAKALIAMGINPTQFSVKGFGEYKSLYTNDNDENRLKNRRVEIQFTMAPQ